MSIGNWDDIRIALAVARSGTVSGAAEVLGVHHATVIRRIDALESQLGARLFQRHTRGYALTEAGRSLLQTATEADEHFARMAAQISGAVDRIEGELVITSLPDLDAMIVPRLIALMHAHPGLRLTYLTDTRLFRLDVGEAHIAIRAGRMPTEPDYVVLPLSQQRFHLYASAEYVAQYGDADDPTAHRFVTPGPEGRNAPFVRWIMDHVPPENVVLTSSDTPARNAAICAGLAIGTLPDSGAEGLIRLSWPQGWQSDLWLVTHVDLHRTPKVQAALGVLRASTQ